MHRLLPSHTSYLCPRATLSESPTTSRATERNARHDQRHDTTRARAHARIKQAFGEHAPLIGKVEGHAVLLAGDEDAGRLEQAVLEEDRREGQVARVLLEDAEAVQDVAVLGRDLVSLAVEAMVLDVELYITSPHVESET